MPQNPFTVVPGKNYGPGLRGLSDTIGQIGEQKRKEEAEQKAITKFATMKQGAMEAYRSGDPDTIAEFSLANPEMEQAMSQSMGFKSKQTEQNYQDSLFDLYQNPSEENVQDLVESRQELLRSQGVGPEGSQETDQFIQRYMADPEKAHKEIGAELAFRYPKKWKSMQGDREKGFTLSTGQKRYDAEGKLIATGQEKEIDPYEGLESGYETYLRAKQIKNTPENYDKYQGNKSKLAAQMRKQKIDRPNIARLMASGWVPSTRITEPMLDAYEAAAERAEKNGEPLSVDDLYSYEFNAQKNRATGRTSGGRLALSRKQNIESGRELLSEMKVTANQLDFSNIKMVGAFEKFKKGELSDPVFAEYMAQRADALFVITAAMKMNGVTDKAIEIEEEAFPVNSSPRVFNAWFNTQMRALNRAGKEMNKDFKYGIDEIPTFPAGQGGAPTPENPIPTTQEGNEQVRMEAPQSAINFLINNPQHAEAFKGKYGYLPKEMVTEGL